MGSKKKTAKTVEEESKDVEVESGLDPKTPERPGRSKVGPKDKKGAPTAQPLKLEISDGSVGNVPAFGEPAVEGESEEEPVADFTVEDAKLLSQAMWNVPAAILGNHLEPDEKLVERFGEQLFGYCQRKEINLWDYAFLELPLLISGGAIAGTMVKAQMEHMAEVKALKEAEEEKKKEENVE